jgi:hypothetical protein
MLERPLLMFRIGHMVAYDGVGEIRGGGAHVDINGNGGEMWNFRAEGGKVYGYAMTKNFSGVDLLRLDNSRAWNENDELDGVDVVFFAKQPGGRQAVVGWYRDAKLFHKSYRKRRGQRHQGDWESLYYLCEADVENTVLLDSEGRDFEVPYAPAHGKGFPGHANIWYGGDGAENSLNFLADLRKYLNSVSVVLAKKERKGKSQVPADKDLISRIEKAAVDKVWTHFEMLGYALASVEKDNRGWDLEAVKGDEILHLEVKGHIGNVVQFELTPNEYSQMKSKMMTYRVCMVRTCLGSPELSILVPKEHECGWMLESQDHAVKIALTEKIAAKAGEISDASPSIG